MSYTYNNAFPLEVCRFARVLHDLLLITAIYQLALLTPGMSPAKAFKRN
jgi:hypothetical protein